MVPEHALKWGELCGRMAEGVLCILSLEEKPGPILLIFRAECPHARFPGWCVLLVHWTGDGNQILYKAHHDPLCLHEGRPDPRCELRPLVTDYVLWNAIVSKHMVEYKFHQLRMQWGTLEGE